MVKAKVEAATITENFIFACLYESVESLIEIFCLYEKAGYALSAFRTLRDEKKAWVIETGTG